MVDTHPGGSKFYDMQLLLSVEQEAQLSQMAAQEGRSADELVREAIDCFLEEEARFCARVQEGMDAADRGELLTSAEE